MPKTITNYTEERKNLLNKLLEILGIDKTNNMLSLKKLDDDVDKQNRIMELETDIKKYFLCSRWTYFSNKKREFKRVYLSLIKAIMKDMNIKILPSTLVTKTEEKKRFETFYIFEI